jgi:proline iminopeptidase
MNEFYPEITPYNSFMLAVDQRHQIYIEQSGNPQGQPVVFLHGGPGSGCSASDRRFFDPDKYRIILFDQRGCGRSLPHGALEQNETALLVNDIEQIRQALAIDSWHVFGGSWGSTLALVYAQTHPARARSLVLRGIFLGRPEDCHWTFTGGGASRIFPDYWQDYLSALPPGQTQSSVRAAYEILTGTDRKAALKLARAWSTWEMRCCTLLPNKALVAAATSDESSWTLARHEAHYMAHDCFLSPNQILDNCASISDLPITIVHGRYDIVCPFDNAWLLHQQLPGSELVISESSGHSASQAGNKSHLIAATRKMLTV